MYYFLFLFWLKTALLPKDIYEDYSENHVNVIFALIPNITNIEGFFQDSIKDSNYKIF